MVKKKQYTYQMERFTIRKLNAIKYKGGKCIECGYDKCHGALEFHHRNPKTKKYNWNQLKIRPWKIVLKELDKCDLLCANCHREKHTKKIDFKYKHDVMNGHRKRPVTKICKCCKETFDTLSNAQKYCDDKCRILGSRKQKRPSVKVLIKEVASMGYCATGRKYNVSDNCIRKWIKLV